MAPGKVALEEKVIQVSAGDSHTAALTETGQVYLWGTFRVRFALCPLNLRSINFIYFLFNYANRLLVE